MTDHAVTTGTAGAGLEERIRALEDRAALVDLAARYARAVDDHDIDAVVAAYTEDATFERAGAVTRGRADLRTFFVAMMDRYTVTIHTTHSHLVTLLDDVRATGLATGHAELAYRGTRMLAAYRYDDEYRRVAGQWLFARRSLQFLYVSPTEYLARIFGDTDRIRWPEEPARPADLPESLPTWTTYDL